jgi:hypothetical protein
MIDLSFDCFEQVFFIQVRLTGLQSVVILCVKQSNCQVSATDYSY